MCRVIAAARSGAIVPYAPMVTCPQASRPLGVHHEEWTRHGGVDHGAGLRNTVEVEAGATPRIAHAELSRHAAAHGMTEDADATKIESGRDL